MKLKDLSVALKELDIPCGAIDLRGGLPDNAYCIDRIGKIWEPKKWEVYYSEKGGKYDSVFFDSEDEACEYLYRLAKGLEDSNRNR